ncbi:hypothetical protein EDM68_05655 [Candidatus Uhrbacteria bacterium]|nr:MAG: hypothetical protein EDM68_05655 [Candidatus Uhrbacteria bacterium]
MKKLREWSQSAKIALVVLWLVVFTSSIIYLVWRFGEHPNVQGTLTVQSQDSMIRYRAVECQGQARPFPSVRVTFVSASDAPEPQRGTEVILQSSETPLFLWKELEKPDISLYRQKIVDSTKYTVSTQVAALQCEPKTNTIKIRRMLSLSRYGDGGFKWTGSFSATCENEEGERLSYELTFEPCL